MACLKKCSSTLQVSREKLRISVKLVPIGANYEGDTENIGFLQLNKRPIVGVVDESGL